jgi:integrase
VLKRGWSIAETPYPKKVRHLPGVHSQEEVARLIEAADTPFHRILLMTLYATGARRAEAARLRVGDIDSQRMVVHIHEGKGGKGGKDRDVMLSPKLLEELRVYWRGLRRKPKEWLCVFAWPERTIAEMSTVNKRPIRDRVMDSSLLAPCPDQCVSIEDKSGSLQPACTAASLASAINSSTDHWS